ncbi:MAG: nucleotidyl transferase AbiEii/AbiGii toxin family protein [Myxococcota bacterium]
MNLFDDFRDLLAAFEASKVRFVLLGGYAVSFHGKPRSTKDIDLLVDVSPENRRRVSEALAAFGAPPSVVADAKVQRSDQVLYFGVSPVRVDILGSASGIAFDGVFERAVRTTIDGVPVRVIALEDLIANKLASGRTRDLEDVKALRAFHQRDETEVSPREP